MAPVYLIRLVLVAVYAAYLIHVGLLLLILPWSEPWAFLLLKMPPLFAGLLDQPAVRGALSAFGLLHLALVAADLLTSAEEVTPTPAPGP